VFNLLKYKLTNKQTNCYISHWCMWVFCREKVCDHLHRTARETKSLQIKPFWVLFYYWSNALWASSCFWSFEIL